MNGWKRLWKNSKGQSIVEFALSAMVMIVLLLGTIDVGLMFFKQYGLSSIAKDTARAVSVGKSSAEINNLIEIDAQMVFEPVAISSSGGSITVTGHDGSTIAITIEPNPNQRQKGETVKVTVDYPYQTISFFLPETVMLSAKGYTLIEETKTP